MPRPQRRKISRLRTQDQVPYMGFKSGAGCGMGGPADYGDTEREDGAGEDEVEEVDLDDNSPGRRALDKSVGSTLAFGIWKTPELRVWELRNTPPLVESLDRIVHATSKWPEHWVVEISGREIIEQLGAGVVVPETLGQINNEGLDFVRLKARIRFGEVGEQFVDVDIATGTRVSVEGNVVAVTILAPVGYVKPAVTGSEITLIGVSLVTNSNIVASAYTVDSFPDTLATYTHTVALAGTIAYGDLDFDVPPRAHSVTIQANQAIALADNPQWLESGLALTSSLAPIVTDAATFSTGEVIVPKVVRQLRIPAQTPATDRQFTITYTIR